MKMIFKPLSLIMLIAMIFISCKKSSNTPTTVNSPIVGFWTYKEDTNVDLWNDNVVFKSDGTFRMYVALSLADTSAAQAAMDTAGQVVTFGTYTVKGTDVEMVWKEFNTIGFKFSGILNGSNNQITGNIETDVPGSAMPLWYLTKP